MLSDASLAAIRASAEEVVANLQKDRPSSPHLPEELEKLKQTMDQIEREATMLEKRLKTPDSTSSDTASTKAMLSQYHLLLQQYSQQFEQSIRALHSAIAQGLSPEGLLKSLRQNMKYGWVRVTFTYSLLIQVPFPLLHSGKSDGQFLSELRTDITIEYEHRSPPESQTGPPSVISAEEWLQQQAKTTSLHSKDVSDMFNSSLADLTTFTKPIDLRLSSKGNKSLKLSKLKVLTRDDQTRTILWLNDAESIMLEHQIERGTIPWTDANDFDHYEVSFPYGNSHVFIKTDVYGTHRFRIANPKYEFNNNKQREKFESYVRERDLLGSYDATSITISYKGRGSEIVATGQYIKVWQGQDETNHLTFTFLVNGRKNVGHVEFDVDSVGLDPNQSRNKLCVRLKVQEEDPSSDREIGHLKIQRDNFDAMHILLEDKDDVEEFKRYFKAYSGTSKAGTSPQSAFLKGLSKVATGSSSSSARRHSETSLSPEPTRRRHERHPSENSTFLPFGSISSVSPQIPEIDVTDDWGIDFRFPGKVNQDNWKELLHHLPTHLQDDIEFKVQPDGTDAPCTWTFYPSPEQAELATPVPLEIKGIPVIIPATPPYPLVAGSSPPPDPWDKTIDPSSDLDSAMVRTILDLYDFAIGFYLLMNGNIQIIVTSEFDAATAYSRKPNYFGGLRVSYIPIDLNPTSKRSRRSLGSLLRRRSPNSSSTAATGPTPISQLTPEPSSAGETSATSTAPPSFRTRVLKNNEEVEARVMNKGMGYKQDEDSTHPYLGKVALRTQFRGEQYLTVSTHVLSNAFMMKPAFNFWKSRTNGASVQDLLTNVGVYFGGKLIGNIHEVYDKDPKDYPGGYNHDISLIKPKDRKDIENVSTPNVRWIKKEEWRGLQKGGVEVEILGQEAQTLRNDNERSCLIVGRGYFRSTPKKTKSNQFSEADPIKYSESISRCLLYRLRHDWREPYGYSGVALVAKIKQPDGTEDSCIAGFQSFVQRAHARQDYDYDEEKLIERMRKGQVCFYGAFEVPEGLAKHEIL